MGDSIFSHIKSPKVCFMKTINKLLYVYYELLIRCYELTASKTDKLQRMFGGIMCVVLQNRLRPFQFCWVKMKVNISLCIQWWHTFCGRGSMRWLSIKYNAIGDVFRYPLCFLDIFLLW